MCFIFPVCYKKLKRGITVMKFDSDLGNAIDFLWMSNLNLKHAVLLQQVQISTKRISYQILAPRQDSNILDVVDQVHFPGFASPIEKHHQSKCIKNKTEELRSAEEKDILSAIPEAYKPT